MAANFQGTDDEPSLAIDAALFAALLADARADAAHERCGLLLGQDGRIMAFRPAANVAADTARHFEIDPVVLIAAHRDARGDGGAVIGHYHSHPTGRAQPSATDAAMAAPDNAIWLIVTADDARAWRAGSDGAGRVRFMPARLAVTSAAGSDFE